MLLLAFLGLERQRGQGYFLVVDRPWRYLLTPHSSHYKLSSTWLSSSEVADRCLHGLTYSLCLLSPIGSALGILQRNHRLGFVLFALQPQVTDLAHNCVLVGSHLLAELLAHILRKLKPLFLYGVYSLLQVQRLLLCFAVPVHHSLSQAEHSAVILVDGEQILLSDDAIPDHDFLLQSQILNNQLCPLLTMNFLLSCAFVVEQKLNYGVCLCQLCLHVKSIPPILPFLLHLLTILFIGQNSLANELSVDPFTLSQSFSYLLYLQFQTHLFTSQLPHSPQVLLAELTHSTNSVSILGDKGRGG